MQGIDVLYDHYKETFKLSKDAQAQRNRCFVILCFLEAISFLMIIQSDAAISVLSGMVIKYSESHIVLGSTIPPAISNPLLISYFCGRVFNT